MWVIRWFSSTPLTSLWAHSCPLGVLSLRLFTLLVCNDADRCIQLRDNRLGFELMEMAFADVVASGWPVFSMLGLLAEETKRISFPLDSRCDDMDTGGNHSFRENLVRALAEDEYLPYPAAFEHIHGGSARCPLGVAAAHFTMAAASNACPDCPLAAPGDEVALSRETRSQVDLGQWQLLTSWSPLQQSLYDLITTQWPVWRALERAGKPTLALRHREEAAPVAAELVFCGSGWPGLQTTLREFAEQRGWALHFLIADMEACPAFYLRAAEYMPAKAPVAVLSPLLWAWDSISSSAVAGLVELVAGGAGESLQVVGAPTLDSDSYWDMNMRHVQVRDWRLTYKAYPTGYPDTHGDRCFESQAPSATRVYRTSGILRSLAELVAKSSEQPIGMSWLVDMDLQMKAQGILAYTCMGPPVQEESYIQRARLTEGIARRYFLERAEFSNRNQDRLCLSQTDKRSVASQQLPAPCLELETRLALQAAVHWWKSSSHLGSTVALLPSSGNMALLLTHGEQLLRSNVAGDNRGGGAPLPLDVCVRRDGLDVEGVRAALADVFETGGGLSLPMELLVRWHADKQALLFESVRLRMPVLQLAACSPTLHVTHGSLRLPGLWTLDVQLMSPALQVVPAHGSAKAANLVVLLCAPAARLESDIREFVQEHGWLLHSAVVDDSGCLPFLQSASAALPDSSAVLLLPSTLWAWNSLTASAVLHGLSILKRLPRAQALSFPTLDDQGNWHWGLRRIRQQYWKLYYHGIAQVYPTEWLVGGEVPEDAQNLPLQCAVGHAGSGSRLFRSASQLKQLLSGIEADPDNAHTWQVMLDLRIQSGGIDSVSCFTAPMHERDYLAEVRLTRLLAHGAQVEVARFGPDRLFEFCLPGSNWFAVAKKGLVAPWCFRRDVEKAFRDLHAWWTQTPEERNFVVPEEGTLLALFRNGAQGMLPWDSDFDAKLYSERPNATVEAFMARTKDADFQRLEIEAYSYRGCGQDSYVLLRRPNITHHMADLYVSGGQPMSEHPWRADLLGTEVHLSGEHLEHIFFNRYRTPVRKLFGGDGIPLQCFLDSHNCLPDCRDTTRPCEFEDEFVHVDFWVPAPRGLG
eukprot:TRINITY_DN61774_c0_g1_i4.p1 TRINITY_DN61774_c0_g1~~TRINITY_DN61774_c0_g1_i4.p1  ORF type:complete len:1092 (+),score=186.54 TRINITY_DN61774_c0_g1_i4:139-3414(+)